MIDRLLVINDLSWPKGGASALAVQSAIDLKAQGLPVEFLSGDNGADSPLRDHEIPLHALGSTRLLEKSGAAAALRASTTASQPDFWQTGSPVTIRQALSIIFTAGPRFSPRPSLRRCARSHRGWSFPLTISSWLAPMARFTITISRAIAP